ncbi:cytochrome P460 family protein [Roseibacillus ishigakijimensis]|uniref:Cytochrome P460 family protein n=1 Tax=Roseibacillus ishigakijimensis TaxID=454146 RepID=A0A934RM31_9BACT|nr:cytochrome P460 family protein [Roseibacillus ishigakijimensis]MBK1833290.1 cytochrome P460 family protein [Roseibacillus ishigakijimensis]
MSTTQIVSARAFGKLATASVALFVLSAPLFLTSCEKSTAQAEGKANAFFEINADGELIRPTGYRTWVYVGTPLTPNDMNGGAATFPEFHSVYIDPVSYDHYRTTGEFPDGTILVKEMSLVGSKTASSGAGYFMGEFSGLEATIKSKEHFPDAPGNWAYFTFTNPKEGTLADKTKAHPSSSCNACHETQAQDDFVFTQYYPVLRAAKGVGDEVVPENGAERTASNPEGTAAISDADAEASAEQPAVDPQWLPTAETPEVDLEVPLEREALFAYLKEGKYKDFPAKETDMHPSVGPHLDYSWPVRVFMNKIVADSMTAGNDQHPKGSVVIKELFDNDKNLTGWAVMAKTHDDTDMGKGWYWTEFTSAVDATKEVGGGNGVPGCFGCHFAGKDMVRSHFPLK